MKIIVGLLLSFFLLAAKVSFAQKAVTHLVMFKLKEGISKEDERYKAAYQLLSDLPKKIKNIEDWSFGENFSTRPIAYDLGLVSVFDSKKDLNDYLTHPAHVEAANAMKPLADWHIVDFEEGE
jgi:hypothetical protein